MSVHFRPDAAVLVVHTSRGYLITYKLVPNVKVPEAYQLVFVDQARRHNRRRSTTQTSRMGAKERSSFLEGGPFVDQILPDFRMAIKLDAGVTQALALDNELVVVTEKPPAIQCISWYPDQDGKRMDSDGRKTQTSSALVSRMSWLSTKAPVREVVYDRPMNLFAWIMTDGCAYAVQRLLPGMMDQQDPKALFTGHLFHSGGSNNPSFKPAVKAAINSKFSIIAVGCEDSTVWLYNVRDYSGGITPARCLPAPASTATTGSLRTLLYSPDGYYLLAGFEHGWISWTVLGQQSVSTFSYDAGTGSTDQMRRSWLGGVDSAFWIGGGSELAVSRRNSNEIGVFEFARSALVGNMSAANIMNPLLQTSTGIMVYQGHNTADLTTISADISLWHQAQVPYNYLDDQWPLRASAVSPDGRYVAVAGQRGLAHYSVASGRWKVFEDPELQNEFRVRGGMCWHQHILIAAVETDVSAELRLYSRESNLDNSNVIQRVQLSAAAVHIAPSGDDSILVYTHENYLDHYIIVAAKKSVRLAKVGQIGLHGIIRAPARVRAVSWIVPEHQLESGDASKDVAVASVLFLVDGKLVLLQPSTNDEGNLKYDMRVIAQNVEFYFLARDATGMLPFTSDQSELAEGMNDSPSGGHTLRDSLWLFDGKDVRTWIDIQSILESGPSEYGRDLTPAIATTVDFYPLSVLVHKGIIFGAESELVQGRDNGFPLFRSVPRTSLFIPDVLRHQLAQFDSPGALHLSHRYQQLPYFAHALEVLLHNVLDEEVEAPPAADESGLLASVLSFLSSFPEYLDVVVQCTRKTELRSWETLFAHLPPPQELFESCMQQGALKTASGYLLVLHTLSDLHSTSPQVIRLLRAAKDAQDWELCKELARFLIALDESGSTLEQALHLVDLAGPMSPSRQASLSLRLPSANGDSIGDSNGLTNGHDID